MTRTFIGVKPGVGPVMKVMANDTDDPLTTPSTSYEKFLFDSEVAAMPAMTVSYSYTITGSALSGGDHEFIPNSTTPVFGYNLLAFGSKYSLELYAWGKRIFDTPNAFHFLRRNAVDWVTLWDLAAARNLDDYGFWFRSSREKYPYYMFLPREVSGVWDIVGAIEFGTSQVADDDSVSDNPPWVQLPAGTSSTDEDAGPYSITYWRAQDWKFAFYQLPLPINDDPYPAVIGTPAADKKILSIKPGEFKLAKPGYDTDAATGDQLIINSDAAEGAAPIRVVKCGSFTLAAGATQTIELGFALDPCAFVDYQAQQTGGDLYLPPLPTSDTAEFNVAYKISGSQILFQNTSALSLDIRYFVMTADTLGTSTGSAKVMEVLDDEVVFRKPSTAGTRFGDVLYSTKQAFMPIVSQGWVPFGDFVTSDTAKFGTHMHVVSLTNGGWKPYVLAKLKRQRKSNANVYYYKPWLAKNTQSDSRYTDSSFIARVSDSEVKFYCSDGTRKEMYHVVSGAEQDPYLNTIGLRYYIFAVPNAL
jgi:hypothetical protein